jgi:hypothetical protein
VGISSGLIHGGLLNSPLLGGPAAPASAAFLLDVLGVSAARAYSMRKLRSAYAGSAIRVRESGGNTEADIGFNGENLNTVALLAHCGSNNGFITKRYDQSGNGDDAVQATTANQPRIVNAGVVDTKNGLPSPVFDGTNDEEDGASTFTLKEFAVIASTTDAGPTFNADRGCLGSSGGSLTLIGQSGNQWYVGGGTPFGSNMNVNNTGSPDAVYGGVLQQIGSHDSTGTTANGMIIGGGFNNWAGTISEAIAYSSELSAGNRAAQYTNQKTYWGTP